MKKMIPPPIASRTDEKTSRSATAHLALSTAPGSSASWWAFPADADCPLEDPLFHGRLACLLADRVVQLLVDARDARGRRRAYQPEVLPKGVGALGVADGRARREHHVVARHPLEDVRGGKNESVVDSALIPVRRCRGPGDPRSAGNTARRSP